MTYVGMFLHRLIAE